MNDSINAEHLQTMLNINIGQHAACWAAIEALTATILKAQPQAAAMHLGHLRLTEEKNTAHLDQDPQALEIAQSLLAQLQELTNTLGG